MAKVFTLTGALLAGLLVPAVLVFGAIASVGGDSGQASTSPLVTELVSVGYENGYLPDEALKVVSSRPGNDCKLAVIGGAVGAWSALVLLAGLDGIDLEGGWCYRTYDEQVEAWTRRQCFIPGNCDGEPYPPTATPGTSMHGWGLAIDVWDSSDDRLGCSSVEFGWMQLNAPRFGWVHPIWAGCGRVGTEPWHWEYLGTESLVPVAEAGW
jgi:D-alanyl-D-alanine carboxypeptidase